MSTPINIPSTADTTAATNHHSLRLSRSFHHHHHSSLLLHSDTYPHRSSSSLLHTSTSSVLHAHHHQFYHSDLVIEEEIGTVPESRSPLLTLVNQHQTTCSTSLIGVPKTHIHIHKHSYLRPYLLLFLALSVTGSFWAFDLPAQLNIPLGARFGYSPDAWQAPFGQLYATYALPNVIMPFVAGRLVDVYGPRTVHLVLLVVVVLGQLLVTCGIYLVSYPWLIVGRFLLGVGGESLSVAQARITCDWFSHTELGFALGFQLAFARLGSVLNDLFTARIEASAGATFSSFSALVVCMTSLVFGILACIIDQKSTPTQYTHVADQDEFCTSPQLPTLKSPSIIRDPSTTPGRHSISRPRVTSSQPSSYVSLTGIHEHNVWEADEDYDTFMLDPHHYTPAHDAFVLGFTPRPSLSVAPSLLNVGIGAPPEPWVLLTYPSTFWALMVAMVSLYVTCNTFSSISSDFLQFKYSLNATQAGQALSLMDICATVIVPVSGLLFERVPRVGQRILVIVNALGLACVFIGLALSTSILYLYVAMALVGTAYAIGASMLWPLIPILVLDPGSLSTAYGVVTCGVNGMLSILPAFFAALIAKDPTFTDTLFTFAGMAAIGALAAVLT